MRVEECSHFDGVLIIKPEVYQDDRGSFLELYNRDVYSHSGLDLGGFVQDNFSSSHRGVLRGLHFQKNQPQAKLVCCLEGEVYDVIVDVRPDSKTFGSHRAYTLCSQKRHQLYIPAGFAHGFAVISTRALFYYKCSAKYSKDDECGILWSDPDLAIKWPFSEPELSVKDSVLPLLKDLSL